jgi:hypothetical protein
MKLIISFVNQNFTPNLKLGLLNTRNNDFSWIGLGAIPGSGCTGIVFSNEKIYTTVQNGNLLTLDMYFNLLDEFELKKVSDPHSIYFQDNKLKIVSTGTNQVINIGLDRTGIPNSESVFWRFPKLNSYDTDIVHMNSYLQIGSKSYVCFLGETDKEDWSNSKKGGIIEINSNKIVCSNLYQPHSLFKLQNKLGVLESKKSTVHFPINESKINLGLGYLRGCFVTRSSIFVAVSSRRLKVNNENVLIRGRVENKEHNSNLECKILELDKTTFKVKKEFDLSAFGNEIYDIKKINSKSNIYDRKGINLIKNSYKVQISELEKSLQKLNLSYSTKISNAINKIKNLQALNSEKTIMIKEKNSLIKELQRLNEQKTKALERKNLILKKYEKKN